MKRIILAHQHFDMYMNNETFDSLKVSVLTRNFEPNKQQKQEVSSHILYTAYLLNNKFRNFCITFRLYCYNINSFLYVIINMQNRTTHSRVVLF